MSIASAIQDIKKSLPQRVQLVAVSKFNPIEALWEAYQAGQRIFGESQAQEMVPKAQAMPDDVKWHFIGHLQTNKVNRVVGRVDLIQSVDSEELLRLINRRAESLGIVQDVFRHVKYTLESPAADVFNKTLSKIGGSTLQLNTNSNDSRYWLPFVRSRSYGWFLTNSGLFTGYTALYSSNRALSVALLDI